MSQHDSTHDPLRHEVDASQFRPIYEDRILVRRLPWPDDSKVYGGGIVAPQIAHRRGGCQLGEVIATGPGTSFCTNLTTGKTKRYRDGSRIPCQVKPGDKVIYGRSEIDEFEKDGERYTFLFEEQGVLALYEEKETE